QTDIEGKPFHGLRATAGGRVTPMIGAGVAGKLLWGPGPDAQDEKLTDMDLGLLTGSGIFQLGATWRNIFGGNALLNQERELAIGGRVSFNQMIFLSTTAYIGRGRMSPYQYGFGMEYVSPYYLSFKGGYRFEPADDRDSYWSAGASFVS